MAIILAERPTMKDNWTQIDYFKIEEFEKLQKEVQKLKKQIKKKRWIKHGRF
jgi:AmiR/NasT family two-component response regulator